MKLLTILLVVMSSCNPTSPIMSQEIEIDAIVNEALEEFHVPGAAVAVVVGDKIVLCRGYGFRDLERGLPATENTAFPIASSTKAFTSFLIGKLIEEGKASWDDPVIQHIPEFRLCNEELTSQVTIRDLLAHRTGIPRNDVLWYLIRDFSEEDALEALPHLPPVSGLREAFQYNNFMYVVAGRVIHNIAKHSWEEELSSRILKPLGMKRSGASLQELQRMEDIAQPYVEIGGKLQKLPFFDLRSTLASSGMHASAADLAKWVQIQLSPGFAKKETLEEMHRVHMPFVPKSPLGLIHMPHAPSEPSGYGLGWEIDAYRNRKHVHHGGIIEGFYSEVSLLPEEKIGVAILTNSSTDGRFATSYIENRIFDHLLGVQDTAWLQKIQEKRLKMKSPLSPLQKYEGRYTHPAYGTMQISLEYDSLVATLGKMRETLKQKEEGVFEFRYPALLCYGVDPVVEFSFISNASGEVEELRVPFEHFRSAPPVVFKR